MKKISGNTTYFKKIFPIFWFGFLAFFLVSGILTGIESPMFIIVPFVMSVMGYFLFKKLVWDLADEVYDKGDELLFRKGNKEQRVKLKDIINIDYSHMNSPERVVVHVRTSGKIGNELAFSLPVRFNPFSKSPLVRELIERVDQAKNIQR